MARSARDHFWAAALASLLVAAVACDISSVLGSIPQGDIVGTAVASTLSALAPGPTTLPATPAATPSPPADGVSMNCDGTYQRFRLTDAGASGKTAWVDAWDGSAWVNVWSLAAGDPMEVQIEDTAGMLAFGACQHLVVLPLRHAGSGAPLELHLFSWNGAGLTEVYSHMGTHGGWTQEGDTIVFRESVYIYGEPTCCPCNTQTMIHEWNGASFLEVSTVLTPTYEGTPPSHCTSP